MTTTSFRAPFVEIYQHMHSLGNMLAGKKADRKDEITIQTAPTLILNPAAIVAQVMVVSDVSYRSTIWATRRKRSINRLNDLNVLDIIDVFSIDNLGFQLFDHSIKSISFFAILWKPSRSISAVLSNVANNRLLFGMFLFGSLLF